MKNTTCLHCGKVIPTGTPESFGQFCDPTCGWFHNERQTRHIGVMYRDADGDWQEDSRS